MCDCETPTGIRNPLLRPCEPEPRAHPVFWVLVVGWAAAMLIGAWTGALVIYSDSSKKSPVVEDHRAKFSREKPGR